MGRVLVIGSLNTDLVCHAVALPRASETVRGSSFVTYPGGKGANQAVAAARAGAQVSFVGAVGADTFGEARRLDLIADGIDISRLRVVAGASSGIALIVVDANGDNQIVIVPGANDAISTADAYDALRTVDHDALSLTLETPLEVVQTALAHRCPSAIAVLNVAPYAAAARALLPAVDVVICNALEAGELLAAEIGADPLGAARELTRLGSRTAIITLGAHGAVVAHGADAWHESAPRVPALDTTGAGDAFCGAFTAWAADGQPLRDSVRAGVAAGALAVTRHGAQPAMPRRQALLDMLRAQVRP